MKPSADINFSDQAIYGRAEKLSNMRGRVFIYPHSARPNVIFDIEKEPDVITAEFVVTEAHAEIMRMYGYKKPIHAIGWHLCEMKSFHKKDPVNILFAPIHPRNHDMDKKINKETFNILRKLDINLTVRLIGEPEECGLRRAEYPNVVWTEGSLVPSVTQIDEADVVVAYETFAYLSVARGIPTVMFGEDMPTHLIPRDRPVKFPKHWYNYLAWMRYPLDIRDGPPMKMLERAARSDEDIRGWRYRMIGEKMLEPDKLIRCVESYL